MHRSTARLLVSLTLTLLLGGFVAYNLYHNGGKAVDVITMQGVQVCQTSRDSQPGRHSCPRRETFVTTCDEARAAVAELSGITLDSKISQLVPRTAGGTAECEMKTVNKEAGLFAILIHAYSQGDGSVLTPITNDPSRSQAQSTLYKAYSNLYLSYLSLGAPITTEGHNLIPFTPAFLVKGNPGFKMLVQVQGEDGTVSPGAGTHIRVSCGTAADMMVAEPSGVSWFSYDGYEKLACGNRPLKAEIIVEKDGTGRWIPGTPTYSFAYEPAVSPTLEVQNNPEAAQVTFVGKWQGIGTKVQVASTSPDGTVTTFPLAKAVVAFSCDQQITNPSPTDSRNTLVHTADAQGRAKMSLADAQQALQGCDPGKFTAALYEYDPTTGAPKDDPAYDFYFDKPGPVLAGTINGVVFPDTSVILGRELAVGGGVLLADVGHTPGGFLSAGSTVCLFLTADAAKAVATCPDKPTDAALLTHADKNGRYLFGGSPDNRLSYGKYLASGKSAVTVRILNYKNEAYPAEVIDKNATPLDPTGLNARDIHLPSSENDLRDHVCQAVIQMWNSKSECDPLYTIIFRESRWDVAATNSSSGACGLFQSNPCEKYQQTALPGEDYHAIGNQIRWGIRYIKSRYGTPSSAWSFWQANGHY